MLSFKKWIKRALSKRLKQERRKAYFAADANDPIGRKATRDCGFKVFVYENRNTLLDYRDLLKAKGIDTTIDMRPMGAAESNKCNLSLIFHLD
ncbi:hypothetical protein [Virgibacillus proomii]|uniref:hypothetical protein n=1 Tax=Virgibacillus proomii TaxID=84407 RepID=UPI001C110F5C|nr:hypothetical protein [Virgibacillus proomii]MBU5267586.1 hypothetical protein [Virgibacillus proomii]